jgi:hypothetical protein
MARWSPPDDALIDDVRREARQQQVGERLRQRQHQDQGELAAMRTEEAREFQHRRHGILAELLSLANS